MPSALPHETCPLPKPQLPPAFDDDVGHVEEVALVATLVRNGEPWCEALGRARELLERTGGTRGLFRATPDVLAGLGVEADAIERLQASARLGLRLGRADDAAVPMTAERARRLVWPELALVSHEEMHLLLLDARHGYAGRRRIASGGSAVLSLHVRDVLAPVIAARQPAFALVHNHPSGDPTPSPEDVAMSVRIGAAADAIGVRFVDHLVVADRGWTSALPGRALWDRPARLQ